MLVVWIGCCLLHRVARHAYPVLSNYGLPIRFEELKNCVTDDKLAIDATLAVASYVKEWTRTPNLTLFSLRDQDEREATIRFARTFAEGNEVMQTRLQLEKEAVQEREEAGWRKVSDKKQQAARKRQEIHNQETQVSELNRKLRLIKKQIEELDSSDDEYELKQAISNKNKVMLFFRVFYLFIIQSDKRFEALKMMDNLRLESISKIN
jgi:hypothetical protein